MLHPGLCGHHPLAGSERVQSAAYLQPGNPLPESAANHEDPPKGVMQPQIEGERTDTKSRNLGAVDCFQTEVALSGGTFGIQGGDDLTLTSAPVSTRNHSNHICEKGDLGGIGRRQKVYYCNAFACTSVQSSL